MEGLAVGRAPAHQLSVKAVPLAQFATDQPHVLDQVGEPVGLHRATPIELGRHDQPFPLHAASAPAEAARLRLALHRVELVPAFEPDPTGFPHEQPMGGAVGPTGQGLDGQTVQVFPEPGGAKRLGVGVERMLRAAVLGTGLGEERLACGIVAGQRPGVLEGFGFAHQPHALARLSQAGGSDLASSVLSWAGLTRSGTSQTNEGVRLDGSDA
jgi:hypothetical protein